MENLLLNLLPARDLERFLRDCEQVELSQRDVLIETDEVMAYAFFPTSGLISQLAVLTDGNAIETGAIGRDGYVGLSSHYAAELSPSRFTVQIPGEAWRMPTTKLREWALELPRLQTLLARYNDYLLAVAGQLAACNRLHNVTQRCARWFLRAADRLDRREIPLTQESLAQILGVRRASVSLAAGVLQEAGIIRYSYGHVEIVDHYRLEQASCECTAALRRRYETLFASLMG